MMLSMRTTVTLDDDVAQRLKDIAHRKKKPFRVVLNDTLRMGFSAQKKAAKLPPFKVIAKDGGLLPGIDPFGFNKLVDELEVEAFLEKERRMGNDPTRR